MFDIPVNFALSWPPPNYANPTIRTPIELWLLSSVFLAGATICVACRLWSRVIVRRWFGLDDLFIVLGYVCAVGVTAAVGIATTHFNWDRHIWDMEPKNYAPSMKTLYLSRIFWGVASSSVRLSVICLYYRLLKACQASWRYFLVMHITTAFNLAVLVYYIFSGIMPCLPIRAYWTFPKMKNGVCFDDIKSMQAAGVINTFAEFQLAVLPLIAVYLLNVRKRQRMPIISLLSLGLLVTLVGCFRTYFIFRAAETFDLTWYSAPQWTCSEVENYLALMCACAVPLRPFVGRTVRKLERKPSRTSSEGTQTGTDSVADWASIMRKVDLEGIGDDGYGYTIVISGPKEPQRTTSWVRAMTSNLLQSRRKVKQKNVESQRLEMTMETEIIVDESTRPMQRSRWGSITTSSSDMIYQNEKDTSLLQYLGDSTMMTPHPEESKAGTCYPYSNGSCEHVNIVPKHPDSSYRTP